MLYSHMMPFLCLLKAITLQNWTLDHETKKIYWVARERCSLLPRVEPTSRVREGSNALHRPWLGLRA